MSDSFSKISIFLTLDLQTINGYFNTHDPAPIYKRQLSHQFDDYIMNSVQAAKRYSLIFYKLRCAKSMDKQYAEPLMYAIRRHYSVKKAIREKEFKKFKRRTWMVMAASVIIVIIFQGFLPLLLNNSERLHTGVGNSLDIFSWVVMWHPIDQLIFHWNPHLKDISLLNKLATAEAIIIDDEN